MKRPDSVKDYLRTISDIWFFVSWWFRGIVGSVFLNDQAWQRFLIIAETCTRERQRRRIQTNEY